MKDLRFWGQPLEYHMDYNCGGTLRDKSRSGEDKGEGWAYMFFSWFCAQEEGILLF